MYQWESAPRNIGGRQNPLGLPVVYTSESFALAALEMLVHTDSALLPTALIILAAHIPATISIQSLCPEPLPNKLEGSSCSTSSASDWHQLNGHQPDRRPPRPPCDLGERVVRVVESRSPGFPPHSLGKHGALPMGFPS